MGECLDQPAKLSLSRREEKSHAGSMPDNYHIYTYTHNEVP